MEPRSRKILAALAFGAILATVETASAGTHPAGSGCVVLTVAIDATAHVPGPLLKDAEQRAADVFRMSNIDIQWVNAGNDARLLTSSTRFTIVIAMMAASVSANVARSGADVMGVMGQAVPDVGRAYVYYDQVTAIVTPTRDIVTILGDVMAHELGHLILPRGHSIAGIMLPQVNMTSRRLETFTKAEAKQLRERLNQHFRPVETN